MLNPDSPIPLYRQLSDLLLRRIRSGEYAAGDRIPSEHQLAAAHSLGRPTVRQAIELLVRRGVLARRRGSGTYVCEPPRQVDLFSIDGTGASFRKTGLDSDTRLLAPVALITVSPQAANPFSGRRAYFLPRLTCVDGAPVLLERIYLNADLFAGIEHMDLQGQSLSSVAEERFFLRPGSCRQSFRIGYPENEEAGLLEVSTQTPVLVVARSLDFSRVPQGVFAQLWCRTDRFVFSQTIQGVGDA